MVDIRMTCAKRCIFQSVRRKCNPYIAGYKAQSSASTWQGSQVLTIAAPFGAGLSITIMIGALLLMSGWTLIAVGGIIRKVTDAVQE